MVNKIVGACPVDGDELIVTELKCPKCGTVIKGEFALSPFDKLSEPEAKFIKVFLKDGGNIKEIEKELNISYPTVKKYLDQVLSSLGLASSFDSLDKTENRKAILEDLKNGKIDFEEAEKRLKDIGETI